MKSYDGGRTRTLGLLMFWSIISIKSPSVLPPS